MTRLAEIVVPLACEQGVEPVFADRLEVSLDCVHCQRTARTVIFTLGETFARCSPGSARSDEVHPPFPGWIVDRQVERVDGEVVATYRLQYLTTPFKDAKYGSRRPWTGHPTWARVAWRVCCPSCQTLAPGETQTNLGRPRTIRCPCGYVFGVERRELPILRYLDPATGTWAEVPERFGSVR